MSNSDDPKPLQANKIAHIMSVPAEDLADAEVMRTALEYARDPANTAARREARAARERAAEAEYARVLTWHDKVLSRWALGPLAKGVLKLHRPEQSGYRAVCMGCDSEGYDAELPEWPCRTYVFVARKVGAKFDEHDRPILEEGS